MNRFMRFRLRTFLAGILTVSAVCGWIGRKKVAYDNEQRALAGLAQSGLNLNISKPLIKGVLPVFL
jgi:hypothetical protein